MIAWGEAVVAGATAAFLFAPYLANFRMKTGIITVKEDSMLSLLHKVAEFLELEKFIEETKADWREFMSL